MAQNQSLSMSIGDLGLSSPQTAITSQVPTQVKKKKPAFNYGGKSPAANSLLGPQTLGQLGGTPLR